MSFSIGGEYRPDHIGPEEFKTAAKEVGLAVKKATERYEYFRENISRCMTEAAMKLADEGYPAAMELRGRILDA